MRDEGESESHIATYVSSLVMLQSDAKQHRQKW